MLKIVKHKTNDRYRTVKSLQNLAKLSRYGHKSTCPAHKIRPLDLTVHSRSLNNSFSFFLFCVIRWPSCTLFEDSKVYGHVAMATTEQIGLSNLWIVKTGVYSG